MIRFKVNGKEYSYDESISLARLIDDLNVPSGSVAIEQNLNFIQRDVWDKTLIAAGDNIELIRPFSGG
ncbi:MAG: sulfur carrier protein ThiS [Nitrospinota bacterium]